MRIQRIILLLCFLIFTNMLSAQISEIEIKGTKKIKKNFIEKIIETKVGNPLDSIQLQDDINTLNRLTPVAYANYKVQKLANGTSKVSISIEENFTLLPLLNVYTTNNEEVAYRVGASEYNFLGQAMVLGGFYQKDIYNSYRINFEAPYLFSSKFGMGISHQNFTTLEPVFFAQGTVFYRYNNNSFEVAGLYQKDAKNNFRLAVNIFKEHYDYQPQEGDVNPPVRTLTENKTLYKLIYNYTDVKYHYQYVNGFKNNFNFQYVTSKNNVSSPNFLIGWNDVIYYKRIAIKGNFATRFRAGLATNNNSPFAPFALDNNVNIRGVGNIIDRGTGSLVWNLEYRHVVVETSSIAIQGNAFIDTGSWRKPGGTFGDFVMPESIVSFSGLGLRFIHKKIANATLRIDYGFGLTENTQGMVFGIGQYF